MGKKWIDSQIDAFEDNNTTKSELRTFGLCTAGSTFEVKFTFDSRMTRRSVHHRI